MGGIKLLDCTLRDGGYINDWRFGQTAVREMVVGLNESGVDIIELGFLKDEPYEKDRTVFNSMEQVKKIIGEKRPGVQYAVMAEVVNPIPLDMIDPADADSADIIRVIVWKTKHLADGTEVDALREGFEYCKGIVDMGYKLCVQPARVDQYSYDEFTDMIKLFNELDPMAVYVVDSFGSQTKDTLKPYFELADRYLKPGVALGYHGHNNMMQAEETAKFFAAMSISRDKLIDASIFGMGRGAGNLNIELFAGFLNENYGKQYQISPLIEMYDKYLAPVYAWAHWGYSVPYYLSAVNGCNPNYAGYMSRDLHILNEDIELALQTIPDEDKAYFTKKKAKKYIESVHESFFKGKLAVIVPTANRPKSIAYYIETAGPRLAYWGVDLIIYDSSSDEATRKIVEENIEEGQKHLIYKKYTGVFDGVSLDEKFISACQEYMDDYSYLWICRDGLLVNIDPIQLDLRKFFQEDFDMIVVSSAMEDVKQIGLKKYEDPLEFFSDNACHMVILGTTIFSTGFLRRVLDTEPLSEDKHYSLYMPIAMFHYIAAHQFKAVHYDSAIFLSNQYGTPSSFWNKNGGALWQWGKQWYHLITNLPAVYDDAKPEVLKVGTPVFTPFGIKQLIIMRVNGSLSLKAYFENKAYLPYVTDHSKTRFFLISLLPKWFCRLGVKKHRNLFLKCIRKLMKKSFYALQRSFAKEPPAPPLKKQEKGLNNPKTVLAKNELCVVIPTCGRPDVIRDVLESSAGIFKDYGIDVLIYDSSDGNETKAVVDEMRDAGFDNIGYSYYQNVDTVSLDEKVMSAYRQVCPQYKYVWMIRDRLLIQLNKCVYSLRKFFSDGVDIISIHNKEDDIYRLDDRSYENADELFKEQFIYMTVLGQTIFRCAFLQEVLDEVPLDREKNYSLWQPVAVFEFIAKHGFNAASYTEAGMLVYHPSVNKGSFWLKQLLWQWVERFYTMIEGLPEEYDKSKKKVYEDEQHEFGLLSPIIVGSARLRGALKLSEIKKYEKIIPYVTKTPVKTFYAIALAPKWCIRLLIFKPNCLFSRVVKKIRSGLQSEGPEST